MNIPQSREEFQKRLQELMNLNKRLGPQENFDGIRDYHDTERELDDTNRMLEREAAERGLLEAQIMALKREMENMYPADDEDGREPGERSEEEQSDHEEFLKELPREDRRQIHLDRKTRYEMEVELLMLKKRIEGEKDEKVRLEALKGKLQNARDIANQTGRMPVWIKQINQIAESSKTLRMKIGKQQMKNPDELSFRFVVFSSFFIILCLNPDSFLSHSPSTLTSSLIQGENALLRCRQR